MKKIVLIIVIAMMALYSSAQFTKATLQATGLTCAMCSNAINKALQKISFIQSVRSDIKNSAFNIVFKQDAEVDIDAIRRAVEDAGFSVGRFKLTGNFNDVKIASNKQVQIGNETFHFLNATDQTLNGEKTLLVVDKGFLTAKEFKKYSAAIKDGQSAGRIYHVTI